jgi:putative restriction endonuclease
MRGYVATTDFEWFAFLRSRQPLEEVNFWQPSAHGFNFAPGTPFFFKLKSPRNAIGGYGVFARYEPATPRLAWDAFGENNGAASFQQMLKRISGYTRSHDRPDHRIGCIMVAEPHFFEEGDWLEQPRDWKRNVVSGAGYDLDQGEGLRIWQECLARAPAGEYATSTGVAEQRPAFQTDAPRFGAPQLVTPRLGQGIFRVAVTAAYGGACAVSGEHSLPALEAAHIRPYGQSGAHAVPNGLLLRADIHRLFDRGYVTVTPERRFLVSPRLAREWENGKVYYALNGQPVHVPAKKADQPDGTLLRWHNENVFEKDAA